ncbi:hypothetical protein [Afifella marina]|uniref:Restriction endonuclease n=1 Tax=Afifella marina DSM 2698 TaxID=1120955 RepID=A0A1G5NAB4_AFIMA|nr:hypothetical protein [Afifella marina]MBK1623103.1 hypothetical protein [Afifella marina DSM 2698]MBK1626097.1 hypothetical protein [Afifella marina]MBK5916975.1 hypothetical protein [Afifella marina]RAI21978.1 hypothetical protein CH311_04455 [Afifella marina DSM 2698]SCZ34094.1 hypothetical protein SAMN03080610_01635 [Afifella marina DSM 2698]
MPNEVSSILAQTGPCLTSDVIEVMVSRGLSESAARKRVQRALPDLGRLAGIRFHKNARFIYRQDDYGGRSFWDGLEKACHKAGKAYWGTIVTLKAHGGRCPIALFPRITGMPAARQRQLSPTRILQRLSEINLLVEVSESEDETGFVEFLPHIYPKEPIAVTNAVMLAEYVALQGIKEWARRIGFGSYGKFALRLEDPQPIVSGISWDLTAPSYFRPLVNATGGKVKPGFLVCDINLRSVVDIDEVDAFVRKCDMASAPAGVGAIMPMLVGYVFSASGLELAKKKGILAVTLENLFGSELAKSMRALIQMLTDAGATAAANPDYLMEVMSRLTKIEGAADNLRGALFELIIGSLVKDVEGGFLKTGERRLDVEIDVQLDRGDEAGMLVIECKSKAPGARVSEKDVKRWYENRVPRIHELLTAGRTDSKPFRYELWTNGSFTDSAIDWLKRQPYDLHGYSVGWRDGTALKEYADQARNASLRKMLNEHYFRSALSVVARSARAVQHPSADGEGNSLTR